MAEQAVLVHVNFVRGIRPREDFRRAKTSGVLSGVSIGGVVTGARKCARCTIVLLARVKQKKLRPLVKALKVPMSLFFNHALSPSQERNLERVFPECRVSPPIDRNPGKNKKKKKPLLLDIFAQRARTHEGKLQVELAQLRHISTRLIRGWTSLGKGKKVGSGLPRTG